MWRVSYCVALPWCPPTGDLFLGWWKDGEGFGTAGHLSARLRWGASVCGTLTMGCNNRTVLHSLSAPPPQGTCFSQPISVHDHCGGSHHVGCNGPIVLPSRDSPPPRTCFGVGGWLEGGFQCCFPSQFKVFVGLVTARWANHRVRVFQCTYMVAPAGALLLGWRVVGAGSRLQRIHVHGHWRLLETLGH